MIQLSKGLESYTGLDVLTDKSFRGSKSVYYRWGAFKKSGRLDKQGNAEELVPNGFGDLIPDVREPNFVLPEGMVDPFDQDTTASSTDTENLAYIDFNQYRIIEALRFTNSGGRYDANCLQSGVAFFIKEARPNTGYIFEENAVDRLIREADQLTFLNEHAPNLAPKLQEMFTSHGHHFLVMERVPGTPLSEWVAQESPLFSNARLDRSEVRNYLKRSFKIYAKIREDIRQLHQLG